jgi:hypothetical protein
MAEGLLQYLIQDSWDVPLHVPSASHFSTVSENKTDDVKYWKESEKNR